MMSSAPKSEALRLLYWRSEILRVVYWLYGEGLGDLVDIALIRQYLGDEVLADEGLGDNDDPRAEAPGGTGPESLASYLDRLVDDGSLVRDGEWYALSARGMAEGEAQLATAFTDLVRPVARECDDECWCHTSEAEAEACARSRALAGANEPGRAHA